MRECGTPAFRVGPTARDEETNVGCGGGSRRSPLRDWRRFSGTARRRRRLRRRRPAATSGWSPVDVAKAVKKIGPGAARGARHRHDDRQRRDQAARRHRDHRGAFRGRRPGQAGRSAVHARQPLDRGRDQARRRPSSPAPRRSSSRRRATSQRYTELVAKNATTLVTLNNAQTQVNISRATRGFQQGDARKSEGAARLLHHPRADLRPHQHGERQGRQLRAAGRYRAACDHQSDRADLRDLHGAAAQSARRARRRSPPRPRRVEAVVPGSDARATGQVTMIENTVDPATGMVTVRATMPNDERSAVARHAGQHVR